VHCGKDLRASGGYVVRGYVLGSTYAANALARVARVGVLSEVLALGDVERLGGDDLVQRVRGAGEDLAGIAMAIDMLETYRNIWLV
jgi:hypothetical protein